MPCTNKRRRYREEQDSQQKNISRNLEEMLNTQIYKMNSNFYLSYEVRWGNQNLTTASYSAQWQTAAIFRIIALTSEKNLSDLAQPLHFTDVTLIQVICFPVLPAGNITGARRSIDRSIYLFNISFQWPDLLRSGHFSQDFYWVWIWDFFNVLYCFLKNWNDTENVTASGNWQLIIPKQKEHQTFR